MSVLRELNVVIIIVISIIFHDFLCRVSITGSSCSGCVILAVTSDSLVFQTYVSICNADC